MIRIDAVWLAVAPTPPWPGYHAYVFANARATRMKVLMHDGLGLWLAARRLHDDKFNWAHM